MTCPNTCIIYFRRCVTEREDGGRYSLLSVVGVVCLAVNIDLALETPNTCELGKSWYTVWGTKHSSPLLSDPPGRGLRLIAATLTAHKCNSPSNLAETREMSANLPADKWRPGKYDSISNCYYKWGKIPWKTLDFMNTPWNLSGFGISCWFLLLLFPTFIIIIIIIINRILQVFAFKLNRILYKKKFLDGKNRK